MNKIGYNDSHHISMKVFKDILFFPKKKKNTLNNIYIYIYIYIYIVEYFTF